jgi:predicted secreted Zn-dependent protease
VVRATSKELTASLEALAHTRVGTPGWQEAMMRVVVALMINAISDQHSHELYEKMLERLPHPDVTKQ